MYWDFAGRVVAVAKAGECSLLQKMFHKQLQKHTFFLNILIFCVKVSLYKRKCVSLQLRCSSCNVVETNEWRDKLQSHKLIGKVDCINYLTRFQTAKSWKNFIGTNLGGS